MKKDPRIQTIISKLKVPVERADEVDEEVAKILEKPGLDDDVIDQTSFPYVTIDNEDSRDLDQALFVEPTETGWTIWYALADASYYVKPGSALYKDAIDRGTSFYFPTFAIPMLPEALSEGLVSLNPDVVRRALVFEMGVDREGNSTKTNLFRAKIKSHAKLAYTGVQMFFDDGAKKDVMWAESMRALRDVGNALMVASDRRGVIQYDRSEANISQEGDRFVLTARARNDVERWNEQVSLLTNTEGARILKECGREVEDLQSVYRVHLAPMQHRLNALFDIIAQVCDRHELGDEYRWDGKSQLGAYLKGIPDEPGHISQAIQRQVQYSNRASEYSDRVGPHFALAVDQYARFSSPMREIVGIFTHKEALEGLAMEAPSDSDDHDLRAQIIESGNRAKKVQKKIDSAVMLLAITDLLDADLKKGEPEVRWGTIIGVKPTRVYVLLDNLPLDLKVYVTDLNTQFGGSFELESGALVSAQTSFGLGDRIGLKTDRFDEDRRRFVFNIVRPS